MSALLHLEGKGGGGGDRVNMSTLTGFWFGAKKALSPVTLLEIQSLVNCMLISSTSLYTCRDKELHFKC